MEGGVRQYGRAMIDVTHREIPAPDQGWRVSHDEWHATGAFRKECCELARTIALEDLGSEFDASQKGQSCLDAP